MIYMGFRLGEMVIIKPEDVFIDKGYIITEVSRNRIIPFPDGIPEIADFFRNRMHNAAPDKPLFDMNEKQFRHTYFYQPLSELGMVDGQLRAGSGNSWVFPDKHHLTPHSTRHTFASLSAAAGMRPENLQKIIGHADYSTTADIYIHKDISELISEMSRSKR